MTITSPTVGLVMWFTGIDDDQPWPAKITACLDSCYIVNVFGDGRDVQSAKSHQLSRFECNLANAIVSDLGLRARLSVACASALNHANSESGIPTQRADLTSTSFSDFLGILSTPIPEFDGGPSHSENHLSEDIPAAVHSALIHLRRMEDQVKEKQCELIVAERDAVDAELFQLAEECAADAYRALKERSVKSSQNAMEELRICRDKHKQATKLLQNVQEMNSKGLKRKNHVLFESEKRTRVVYPSEDEELVEEEVLDESGQGVAEHKGNWEDVSIGNARSSSKCFYLKKVVSVDKVYEKARAEIGLRMLSNRYMAGTPSGDCEEAFKMDLVAWLEETDGETLAFVRLGGVVMNPYKVFMEVIGRGGIEAVIRRRELRGVLRTVGHVASKNGTRLKAYYMAHLYSYENYLVHGKKVSNEECGKVVQPEKCDIDMMEVKGNWPIDDSDDKKGPKGPTKLESKLELFGKAAHNLGKKLISRKYANQDSYSRRDEAFVADLTAFLEETGKKQIAESVENWAGANLFQLCSHVLSAGGIIAVEAKSRFNKICADLEVSLDEARELRDFYYTALYKYEERLVHVGHR